EANGFGRVLINPLSVSAASTSKSSSFHSPDKRGNSRRALGSVESPDGSFLQRFVTARRSPSVIPCTPARVGGLVTGLSHQNSHHQYGRWRRAVQPHVRAGIGN